MTPTQITPEANFLLISKASDFAKGALADVKDRQGRPAYLHSEAVAGMLTDPLDIVVGYLHDVLEDTQITLAKLFSEFGSDVVHPVFLLTRPIGMPWNVYTRRIMMQVIDPFDSKHHFRAARVKIADMTHNLSRMDIHMAEHSRNGDMYRESIDAMKKFLLQENEK